MDPMIRKTCPKFEQQQNPSRKLQNSSGKDDDKVTKEIEILSLYQQIIQLEKESLAEISQKLFEVKTFIEEVDQTISYLSSDKLTSSERYNHLGATVKGSKRLYEKFAQHQNEFDTKSKEIDKILLIAEEILNKCGKGSATGEQLSTKIVQLRDRFTSVKSRYMTNGSIILDN